MLIAWVNGARVEAGRGVERKQAFTCPGCGAGVILKAGQIKIAHFAHKPGFLVCSYSQGETLAHLTAKKLFCDSARARGLRAELEFPVGDQRVDVAIWSPDDKMFVIEIQHTSIDVEELRRRAAGYTKKGIAHVWVPTIRLANVADRSLIDRYSIRPFERYLAGIYKKLWLYVEGDESIAFCEVRDHWLYKEDYYNDYTADYHIGGDYKSTRWVDLFPEIVCDVEDIRYSFTWAKHGLDLDKAGIESAVPTEPVAKKLSYSEIRKPERIGLPHYCGECGRFGMWGYLNEGKRDWFCREHRL